MELEIEEEGKPPPKIPISKPEKEEQKKENGINQGGTKGGI